MVSSRKRTVEIDVVVDDKQASSKLKGLGTDAQKSAKGFSGLSTGMKTAALAGGAFVATNIVSYLGDAAQAAIDDEAAQADLELALKNTTGATDDQVAATEDFIKQTSLATGVADDELRPALETLTRATGDLDLAQDHLAVAMDIAAATGKPLQTVVDAIAKAALNGSTGGLARMGIAIKDINGNALSLDEILQNASRTMGGAMATRAETAAGKMDRLRVAMDEAKEELGGALLPAIEGAIPLIMEAIKPLSLAIIEVNQWTGAISDMEAAVRTWEVHMGRSADTAAAALQIWQTGNIDFGDLLDNLKLAPSELAKLRDASDDFLISQGATNETIEEFRTNLDNAMHASMDSRGEQTKQRASLQDVEDQADETAGATDDLTQATLTYTETLQKSADPVFAAVDAANNLADAQATLTEKQGDSETSAAELADAQLDVAEALLGAQGAMDKLSPAQLNKAVDSISDVLNISEQDVRDLLRELNILDGTSVRTFIEIATRITGVVGSRRRSNVGGPGGILEHSGGTIPGQYRGQEVQMTARAGEFVSQGGRPAHSNGHGGGDIVIQVDGREIARAVRPHAVRDSRTGKPWQ